MNVVISIDGRDAIPVRAIPFATGWRLSPDGLAKDLARHRHRAGRAGGIRAFQFDPDHLHPHITPPEWDDVIVKLNALDERLNHEFGEERDALSYEKWRATSPLCFPKGCFLWRDEFETAFRSGKTSAAYHDAEETLELNFSPLIPSELESVVLEGFQPTRSPSPSPASAPSDAHASLTALSSTDRPFQPTVTKWPWGNHETALLQVLERAAARFWVNTDISDLTTMPTNETVIKWLVEDQHVSTNIAKSMATILRPDGLKTGPRK